jgi:UDP-N-acetylglucosamine--N-acetylmuramyl-(pentapeptide) pyrophosphoryl-undecaprenol N-acetylglucosamine transferase
MVADADVETGEFADKLFAIIGDAGLRASMHAAAASFDTVNAAEKLADVVEGVV